MKFFRLSIIGSALCLAATTTAMAQKIKLIQGDLGALSGQTSLNVQYDYSSFTVGKNLTEAQYIQDKKKKYNDDEPGRGDTWEKSWINDRESRYEVQFKEEFEKQSGMTIGNNPNAKYTLIFKTTHVEPGYNIYVSRKNASLDGEAWIVETANPSNVIAKMSVDNCPGRTFGGYDYDTGTRIQESYAVAGKGLGKFLKKGAK